jgi:hypothetical protein
VLHPSDRLQQFGGAAHRARRSHNGPQPS